MVRVAIEDYFHQNGISDYDDSMIKSISNMCYESSKILERTIKFRNDSGFYVKLFEFDIVELVVKSFIEMRGLK